MNIKARQLASLKNKNKENSNLILDDNKTNSNQAYVINEKTNLNIHNQTNIRKNNKLY